MYQHSPVKKKFVVHHGKRLPTVCLWLSIFGLGYCVGFLQSYLLCNNNQSTDKYFHQVQNGEVFRSDDNTGWNTLDVFYGKVPSDADLQLSQAAQEGNNDSHPWFSQLHQDEVVMALLSYKQNGFFIDLAANDARHFSNTFALERFGNWTGLCIEPNPLYWLNLTRYRPNCHIISAVVGKHKMEEVYFRFDARELGGIAGDGFDNGKRWKRSSEKQYTIPLVEIFQRFHVPKEIDYLSLDVEGAETYIMESFPFQNYRLKGSIRTYLKENGYEFVMKLSRWGESLWILSSIRDELNWSAFEGLSSKIQRNNEKKGRVKDMAFSSAPQ